MLGAGTGRRPHASSGDKILALMGNCTSTFAFEPRARAHGRQEEVQGLPAEPAMLRASGGGKDAVVRWLRQGAQGVAKKGL